MEMVTGTRVRLRAAVDRPLASARLVARPNLVKLPWTQPITPLSGISAMSAAAYLAISDEFRQEIPVHLHGDRQLLDIDFFPRYSGSYALRIADEDGFWSERLFEVRVDADPAPRVLLLKQNDDDLTALVPEADVPIQAIVCDEQYGIRSVQLEYRTEATQAFRGWPMADAAKQHIIGDALLPLMAMPCRFPHLERPKPKQWPLAATYPLSLFRRSDGTALREGDTIALRISARDWDDVTWNKPAGVSETAEISIVSPDQIEAALLKKLAQLRNDLLMIRDQQTIARQRLRDLIEAPAKSADALAEIERLQQQIQAAVISNIRPRLGQLERGVRNNNLPDSRTSQRIAMAKAEIEQLLQRELSPLPALLEQGRQTPATLPQAERLQSEAIERLQALIDRLHAWNGTAEARGETRALVGELRKLIERLDDVQQSQSGAATGIRRDELNEFRRNELDSLTQSIDSVREKARLLLERLEQQARSPENIPSAELDRLRAALKKLDRPALGQGLQSAAEQAKQNRLSDARGALGKAGAPLAQLLQDLDEKPPAEEFDRLKKAARANSKEIDRLIDAQEKLQHRIDEAGRLADPAERARQLRALAGEQSKIRDQAEEVIRTLTRQGEDRTLAQVRQAAREMEKTRQQLEDGQVPTGERDAALDSLDEGKEAVEQQAEKAAEELARVQQAQDGDLIRALRERQAGLRDEAARLHAKVGEQKQWDAATARGSLPGLIESQGGLAIETRRLLETRFKGELVSAALLNQAASSMEGATKRLQERKEDVLDQLDGLVQYDAMIENAHQTRIIAEQDRALRRLDLLLDTAKPDASKKDAAKSGEPKQGNESARNNLPSKAQLKVLRALQAELKDRTTEFDRQHPDRQKLGEAARLQLDALTREQDEFVELVRSLTAGVREELP